MGKQPPIPISKRPLVYCFMTIVIVLRDWLTRHKDFKLIFKDRDIEIVLCGDDQEKLSALLTMYSVKC